MGLDVQGCLVQGTHPEAHVAALHSQVLQPSFAEPESQCVGLTV